MIYKYSIIFREWVNISPMKYTELRINDQVRATVESGSKCVFKSAVALNLKHYLIQKTSFNKHPKDLNYIDVKIKVKCDFVIVCK